MKTDLTKEELTKALETINKEFNNNIIFYRLEQQGKRLNFTLKVKNSSEAGARIGFTGRKVAKACWHVHGKLFDAMFDINPNVIIYSQGKRITKHNNWTDVNIGSTYSPFYYSKACNCRFQEQTNKAKK